MTGWFEYNTALFNADTMQRMARHFQNLLADIVVEPNKCLAKLSLLNEREKADLISLMKILTKQNKRFRR